MKFFVACLLFAAASAMPQHTAGGIAAPAPAGGAAAPAKASAAAPAFRNPYGPLAYGMGLNNLFADPHDPLEVHRHVAVARTIPGLLVKVDAEGEVVFTDTKGWVVENIPDQFGRNKLELFGF